MNEGGMQSILGMDLKNILVKQLHAYQSGEVWKYQCGSPVLHFQYQESSERPLYWILSWAETAEDDDQLLIDETQDADKLSQFERVEGFREPVIVSSSIHLESARVQRVIGYGYKDEKQEFLTSIVLKLENVYVTFTSGPVFTVTVTNTFPENMERELFRVGV